MKVDKQQLVKLIELIVRKEVKSAVNEAITKQNLIKDIKKPTPTLAQAINDKPVVESKGKISIAEALESTANQGEWKNMGATPGAPDQPYDSSRMGEILNKQYSDLGAHPNANVDVLADTAARENVSAEAVPDSLKKALSKDYSELVKRF